MADGKMRMIKCEKKNADGKMPNDNPVLGC